MRAGFYFAGFIRVFCWSTCAAELQQQVGRAGGRLRGGREGSREVAVRYHGGLEGRREKNRRREVCQDGVLGVRVRPKSALRSQTRSHLKLRWS